MLKVDPTVSTLFIAGALAIAISVLMNWAAPGVANQVAGLNVSAAHAADTAGPRPQWAASATGRIEPKDGEIRIDAQAPGKIVEVVAKSGDTVTSGDLLARLDDQDLFSKYAAAEAEVLVREREREDEPAAKGPHLDKRKTEDAAAAAERALFQARQSFDDTYRQSRSGKVTPEELTAARARLEAANEKFASEKAAYDRVAAKGDAPLPTRLESALTIARSDLSQIEQAIERARIRAPGNGTVLNVWAKVGEIGEPSPETALVLFGDVSQLRVRAEVEERDVVKIRVGQRVVVRADAYPDREFEGVVTSMAPALGPPRMLTRGPRRPNDVEVLEVFATLNGQPPLLTGMRVDTFFRNETSVSAAPAKTN